MNTMQRPPARPAAPPRERRMTLASVTDKPRAQPDRIFIYGVEKIGKSTFGASAPAPVFISAEDGLAEIRPAPARFPEVRDYQDVLDAVDELTTGEHRFQTLVIDSLDWIAALIHADVMARNRWSQADFEKFGRGQKVALDDWRKLVLAVERLQAARGMEVILIAHAEQKNVDPPDGPSFVRYQPKLGPAAAALWKEWAKSVLFARHEYVVKESDGFGRNKGVSTGRRLLYTNWTAAYDAGSRHALPETLPLDYASYAEARGAGIEGDASAVRVQIDAALTELAPKPEAVQAIRDKVTAAGEDSAALTRLLNVLKNKIAERDAAAASGTAETVAAEGGGA